ncbi:hypothetical protein [Methylobacterium aquaticum]|uniref:hypothetical protein n=1 Tax=Methylobacterium aquaticum TaxID=270351 RepID=UPI001933DC57|nr:hypothetical protein [Methylobacterium aquaticum]QRE77353.1 hypothetical protein F1D61_30935 [Methylobacterium aquaticum]
MTQPATQPECPTKPRGSPTSGIRPAEVVIPLPPVGGVSYAFQGGFLIKDGKRQTATTPDSMEKARG